MRLGTMIYIKELLETDVRLREYEMEKAKGVLQNREEAAEISCWDNSDAQIVELRNRVKKTRELWSKAQDALEDFLSKEWN